MLICTQIRAARGLLRWSARELADQAGLHITTVQRMETGNGSISGNMRSIRSVQHVLERAGINFINDIEGPGVRLRSWENVTG